MKNLLNFGLLALAVGSTGYAVKQRLSAALPASE